METLQGRPKKRSSFDLTKFKAGREKMISVSETVTLLKLIHGILNNIKILCVMFYEIMNAAQSTRVTQGHNNCVF